MKKLMKRVLTVAMVVTMAAGMMTGCSTSQDLKTQNGTKVLFNYDGTDVSLKEAWIYAKMTAAQYEYYYSSYFGTDFWNTQVGEDEEGNSITFEQSVKEQVISQIKQIIVLNNKAEEFGVSLTDEEKEECKKFAKAFADSTEGAAILKECGANEEDMAQIYEKNKIASKVQQAAIADVIIDVTDEEARETTIARIVYPTTKTDDEGTTVDMTEEEKAATLQTAYAALGKIQSGTSLADVAAEAEYTNTSETFAAGESEEGAAFEEKLVGLADGTLIGEVMECDNGYVIAQLVSYLDRQATDNKKAEIVARKQQEAFNAKYEEWTAELESAWDYKTAVDQTLWDEIVFHSEESTAETVEETDAAQQADEAGDAIMDAIDGEAATEAPADTAAEGSTQAQ